MHSTPKVTATAFRLSHRHSRIPSPVVLSSRHNVVGVPRCFEVSNKSVSVRSSVLCGRARSPALSAKVSEAESIPAPIGAAENLVQDGSPGFGSQNHFCLSPDQRTLECMPIKKPYAWPLFYLAFALDVPPKLCIIRVTLAATGNDYVLCPAHRLSHTANEPPVSRFFTTLPVRSHRFASPVFSSIYESLLPQLLCFHNHLRCRGVAPQPLALAAFLRAVEFGSQPSSVCCFLASLLRQFGIIPR